MLALGHIYNLDCLEGMKQIPDKFIIIEIDGTRFITH